MYLTILNVIYVLLALTMAGFILLQRGAGAQAGSGFGSGASGTVFGARGSANFLTKATGWLAAAFFAMSLAMGMYISHAGLAKKGDDLGVMSKVETPAATTPATGTTDVPAAPTAVAPGTPPGDVPAAPAAPTAPAAAPTGTAPSTPAPATPTPAAPAATTPPEPAKQ